MIRALLVAQREFLENVRTKGFWIGIMMMPLMLVLFATVPFLVESTRAPKSFGVIDRSGWLGEEIRRQIEISDLSTLLSTIDSIDRLSPPLKDLAAAAADLEKDQVRSLASFILYPSGAARDDIDALPAKARNLVLERRQEIADLWQTLGPSERAAFTPAISTDRFVMVELENATPRELNELIQQEELFAYFVIGADPTRNHNGFKYVSNNLTDRDLVNWFSDFASERIRARRLKQADIDDATAEWIGERVSFEDLQVSSDGSEEQVNTQDIARHWAPVVFVYLLWISILINTQMLLTSTIEEKSNKLIEVLLSSVSAIELMAGKILGIAVTGLAIIAAWALMGLFFIIVLPSLAGLSLPLDLTNVVSDPVYLGSFLVYFLLGYFLYAAFLVGLGSICSNLKDAQNLMLPVQLIQVVPILVMIPIGRDPNGTLAQILSYVPPLTPFVMMNRAAAPPTAFEYLTTTLLLVVSIVAALWVAAKMFRIGILLTGKPPGIMEVLRLLRGPVTMQGSQSLQS